MPIIEIYENSTLTEIRMIWNSGVSIFHEINNWSPYSDKLNGWTNTISADYGKYKSVLLKKKLISEMKVR